MWVLCLITFSNINIFIPMQQNIVITSPLKKMGHRPDFFKSIDQI